MPLPPSEKWTRYLICESRQSAPIVPFNVAALNEPMAVARHCVNRSDAKLSDKVVVFGAGQPAYHTAVPISGGELGAARGSLWPALDL